MYRFWECKAKPVAAGAVQGWAWHIQAMKRCVWTGLCRGDGWEQGAQYAKQRTPAISSGAAAGTPAAGGDRHHIVRHLIACLTG